LTAFSEREISNLALKYALLNALTHDGRADNRAVIGRLLAENAELRSESKRMTAIANETVSKVNSMSANEQLSILKTQFPGTLEAEESRKKEVSRRDSTREPTLPPLPDAVRGAVVTRFPPEPNGYMHIGHVKAATIGSEYAKMYDGMFILRFDDTNPAAEKLEYYDAFKESFSWLKIKPDIVRNSSDDMDKFYSLAEKLIGKSRAYVCTCSQEKMRELRSKAEECEHRSRSLRENVDLWRKMLNRDVGEGEATLRYKGDMKSLNTTMRDPVLFRIVAERHPLKGNQYYVWPTYDFAGAVEDSLTGVTHAMRSKEYELRDELYYELLRALDLRAPRVIEFSRLNLKNTTVSKRKLKKLIDEGKVEGWDDPRLPTISGLRRRGFLPETIREFVLSMGVSKVESEPSWDLLESINRRLLDPVAKRYFFVPNPVELEVRGAPHVEVRLKYHPERDYGERVLKTNGKFLIPVEDSSLMSPGSMIRLIEAYNVEIIGIKKEKLEGSFKGDAKKGDVPKIQWVPSEDNFPLNVKIPRALLKGEEFNPDSMQVVEGVAESSSKEIGIGSIVQFVRFGFCRIDSRNVAVRAHK
jgi:glutamyl-tRNA synthetase